jgi:hypothetical protein
MRTLKPLATAIFGLGLFITEEEASSPGTIGNTWMWIGFAIFVVVALAIDLLVLDKKRLKSDIKEAVMLVADLDLAVFFVVLLTLLW